MGRRGARLTHLGLSLLGLVLYVVFVIPRWWVLLGDIPTTLATAGRIVAGFPIAAAAVPVALSLQRSLKDGSAVPELALRLRAWSGVLHIVAGVLIVLTAVAEIWLTSPKAAPWLFAVYGAAAAIAVLGVAAFALSFVAEKPPLPPKPAKVKAAKPKKEKTRRIRGRKDSTATGDADDAVESEVAEVEADADDVTEAASETAADTEVPVEETLVEETVVETPADEPEAAVEIDVVDVSTTEPAEDPEPAAGLRNKRPEGKRRHRLRR